MCDIDGGEAKAVAMTAAMDVTMEAAARAASKAAVMVVETAERRP